MNLYSAIKGGLNESDDTIKERKIAINLNDDKSKDIINAVCGQISDGIWENSPGMDKYWQFMGDLDDNGNLTVYNGYKRSYDTLSPWCYSAFNDMDDTEVKKYYANKIKQIVKREGLDWNRNNTEPCEYLNYNSGVTVRDAYKVYDRLLGRIDRITDSEKYKEAEEELDQYLIDLVTKKKDLLTDDTIDDDLAYDLMERIDNELINSYSIEEIEKAEKLVGLDESEEKVMTNLDTNNMVDELRKHFKNITNKNYIKNSLKMHLDKGFINKEEYNKLKEEYKLNEANTKKTDFEKDTLKDKKENRNTVILEVKDFTNEMKNDWKTATKAIVYKDNISGGGQPYIRFYSDSGSSLGSSFYSLNESETEDYWDATELERKGFCALLKFNHPEKHMNPSMRYIITNDNNEVYRFAMQGSTEQIKDTGAKIEFRKYLNSNGLTESESLKDISNKDDILIMYNPTLKKEIKLIKKNNKWFDDSGKVFAKDISIDELRNSFTGDWKRIMSIDESQTQEIEEIITDIRKEVPKIDEYLTAYYKKINKEEPEVKINTNGEVNPDWEDWYRNTANILYNEAAWDKFVAWVKETYNVDMNLNEAEGLYNQAFKVGSKLDLLLSELNTELSEGLKAIGYDEAFKKDYTSIEAKENENNIEIYFIAELDYEEGENIIYHHLDNVLKKYDKDAYFEVEDTGRWIAIINKNMLNEAEGYIKPEDFDSMNDEDLDEYLKFLQSEWTYHTKKRQAEIGNEIDLIEKILTDRGFYIDTSNPDYNSLYFDMDGNQIDKNGNQIPENEPEITDRPKEGFVVFQTTKKEDDPQELEDMVFTTKEEAKEALEEWKNSYTDEEKEQFNPSGIIYKYKGKTPREINASKAQIAQELH